MALVPKEAREKIFLAFTVVPSLLDQPCYSMKSMCVYLYEGVHIVYDIITTK